MSAGVRNVLIVLVLAAAVWAIPGGGTAAGIVAAFISVGFAVGIWLALSFVYRNFRSTIYGLGDQNRGMLYGGLAGLLFAGAAADRFFDTAGGTLIWFAVLAASIFVLVLVFQRYRAYD